jgi:hypothetical protein
MSWQVQDLVLAILDMDSDQLDIVLKGVRLRRTQLHDAVAYENQMKLYVGDRVKVSHLMSAKWQRGKIGTIVELTADDVLIELEKPYYSSRTFTTTSRLRLAYSLVTKV